MSCWCSPPAPGSYAEQRAARKGNTVYVYGSGMVEDSLRSAFTPHGTIIDVSMDNPRKYAQRPASCGFLDQ